MANHPNRSRVKTAASSPTPAQVLAARQAAGHTQPEAAQVVHSTRAAWARWESSANDARSMHPAFFELYKIKTAHELPTYPVKP